MFDLNNVKKKKKEEEDAKSEPPTMPVVETGLVIVPKSIALAATPGTNVETYKDMVDRLMKLIYVIDTSGSMREKIVTDKGIKSFMWLPEEMAKIREKAGECARLEAKLSAMMLEIGLGNLEPEAIEEDPELRYFDPGQAHKWAQLHGLEDEELKVRFLEQFLDAEFSLQINFEHWQLAKSRLDLVKELAASLIEERVKKYPDANIHAMAFCNQAQILPSDTVPALVNAIKALSAFGWTDIHQAVATAVQLCKKAPSVVNSHHIVLVSDGLDSGAVRCMELLPTMKELNIVFDFLLISSTVSSLYDEVTKVLKKLCEATGGEFVKVASEADLKEKFIQAANRLCLPPAN